MFQEAKKYIVVKKMSNLIYATWVDILLRDVNSRSHDCEFISSISSILYVLIEKYEIQT